MPTWAALQRPLDPSSGNASQNLSPNNWQAIVSRSAILYILGLALLWISVVSGPTLRKLLSPEPDTSLALFLAFLSGEMARATAFLAGYALIWVVYCRRVLKGDTPAASVRRQFLFALVFVLLLLPLPPYFSDDIIGYAQHGRVLGHYGANPYLHTLSEFDDPWAQHRGYWASQTSPYGPVMTVLLAGVSGLAGDRLWLAVALLKLIMAGCFLASGWLVFRILVTIAPESAGQGLLMFLWNPMVLLELVGQGHNDAVMIFLMMAGLYFFFHCRRVLGITYLTVSALTKFASGVLLPFVAVFLWRRRERDSLALGASIAMLVVAVLWLLFFRDPSSLGGLRQVSGLSWLSAGWLGQELLQGLGVTADTAQQIIRFLVVVVFLSILLWRMTKVESDSALLRESTFVLLVFLLLVNGQMNPWYLAIAVPMAAVAFTPTTRNLIVALSLWPALLYHRPWLYDPPYWANVIRAVALYAGVLWIVYRTAICKEEDPRCTT